MKFVGLNLGKYYMRIIFRNGQIEFDSLDSLFVFPCMDAIVSVTLLLVGKVNNVTKMEMKLHFLKQLNVWNLKWMDNLSASCTRNAGLDTARCWQSIPFLSWNPGAFARTMVYSEMYENKHLAFEKYTITVKIDNHFIGYKSTKLTF